MKNRFALALDILTILGLLAVGCSLGITPSTEPPGVITDLPSGDTGTVPVAPTGDTVEILSVDPPVPAGISIADPVTVIVRYNMTIPEGVLQVWFERFSDPDCTLTVTDPATGNTTLAGTLDGGMPGGLQEITISVPPLPLLGAAFVGVGVRLWTPETSILVEDSRYEVCYAVQEPPADMPVAAPDLEPLPESTGGAGAISGLIFGDDNRNGLRDSGEAGEGPYLMVLADLTCATSYATTMSDSTGIYAFSGLPAGTYCVVISYSGGVVLPGFFQRVQVVAGNTSEASFAIQPAGSAPPPPTTGYCGDGVLDTGAGEQCDPPNLTDCTASCQTYVGYCGDGYVDPGLGEQCDPPNTTDCTASCQTYVPYCGNFIIDPGEQCDPPNLTNCTASCQIYIGWCGDGYVDPGIGEQCDPPNVDFCTAQCEFFLPNCGNGTIEIGEECDPPNTTNCTAQCQNYP